MSNPTEPTELQSDEEFTTRETISDRDFDVIIAEHEMMIEGINILGVYHAIAKQDDESDLFKLLDTWFGELKANFQGIREEAERVYGPKPSDS